MRLYQGDCYEYVKALPDNSVDLVVMDPPYDFADHGGGGAFGEKKRDYHKEYLSLMKKTGRTKETERLRILSNASRVGDSLSELNAGFNFGILEDLCRVMKKVNLYCWCSKAQLRPLLDYFEDKDCAVDLLIWGKTNPTPMCNNTYLSDIEYLVFAREKGVKVYGSYATKHKYYITPTNTADKKLYGHPTIKPLNIIENLITNSSQPEGVVLDPFMGSGTTGVACVNLGREFIGCELNEEYFKIAERRIADAQL